jgi:hypothetical protein
MDIGEYRQIQSRILFTEDGSVPAVPLCLDIEEQDALLDRISRVWELVESCSYSGCRLPERSTPTVTERWNGLKRWFLSHHLFISQLALTGFCLKESVERSAKIKEATYWASLASRLRKSCGALFLYGIDFKPCAALYSGAIRSNMPPAFSGFWIRERQHYFQPAHVRFTRTFPVSLDRFNLNPNNRWAIAEKRYHELHEQSMYAAVPDGKSLSAEYREQNGKPHRISEEQFHDYDLWFCIERSATINRLHYIFQTLDLIERAVADLMSGHRLDAQVTSELLDGWKAAMVIFGYWAGPVPERSRFYPKYLRGE